MAMLQTPMVPLRAFTVGNQALVAPGATSPHDISDPCPPGPRPPIGSVTPRLLATRGTRRTDRLHKCVYPAALGTHRVRPTRRGPSTASPRAWRFLDLGRGDWVSLKSRGLEGAPGGYEVSGVKASRGRTRVKRSLSLSSPGGLGVDRGPLGTSGIQASALAHVLSHSPPGVMPERRARRLPRTQVWQRRWTPDLARCAAPASKHSAQA
jgi:hypothetical protein